MEQSCRLITGPLFRECNSQVSLITDALDIPWRHMHCLVHVVGPLFTFPCVYLGGCRTIRRDVCGGSMLLPIGGRLRVFLWCHRGLRSGLFREGRVRQLEIQWSLSWVLHYFRHVSVWLCNFKAEINYVVRKIHHVGSTKLNQLKVSFKLSKSSCQKKKLITEDKSSSMQLFSFFF